MAPTWSTPRDELSCPICKDVFKDPVLLCNTCVKTWWRTNGSRRCPVCKTASVTNAPPRNLALKNLCEAFLLEEESGVMCRRHGERLKLFCLDHQTPVCVVCRDSTQHANHHFSPVDEAAGSHREDLRGHVTRSREKIEIFNEVKLDLEKADEEIRKQALATETEITNEFNVLVQFFMLDKEFRIAALKEEETRKRKVFEDKIAGLTGEINALERTITTIEDGLREDDDASLLLNVGALRRAAQRPLPDDPEQLTGARIDVAKHLGNMTFNAWCKMKQIVSYTPVILNPNAAHPKLELSEGLTSARCRPDPAFKTIRGHTSALGSEGFTSGRHHWDVEVGSNRVWALGVMAPDAQEMGDVVSGLWMLRYNEGTFSVFSPSRRSVLPLKERPRRVRVQLDWDSGTLSFLDRDTEAPIYTFTHTFTDRLFPYINTWDTVPLKMLPVDLTMTIEASNVMVQLKK